MFGGVAVSNGIREIVKPANHRKGGSAMSHSSQARLKGYEGDACSECGNFTLVRNGTCLKCATCGSTTGCS